jgi:hypothetical protein
MFKHASYIKRCCEWPQYYGSQNHVPNLILNFKYVSVMIQKSLGSKAEFLRVEVDRKFFAHAEHPERGHATSKSSP